MPVKSPSTRTDASEASTPMDWNRKLLAEVPGDVPQQDQRLVAAVPGRRLVDPLPALAGARFGEAEHAVGVGRKDGGQ